MEIVKRTQEYTFYKKRSGRFGVQNKSKKWVNGQEKAELLAAEGFIKLTAPAPKAEPAEEAEAAPEAEATEETAE